MKKYEKISISRQVKEKLRRLKKDSLYDYSLFDNILISNPIAFRKAISRLAKESVIIKVGNGKFYKRGDRDVSIEIAPLRIQPRKSKWLKKGSVSAKDIKPLLSSNLFWSNPNGEIPIENLISAIIKNNALSDLDFARFSFGDNKVIEVFLKNFNIHSRPIIRDTLYV